MLKDYFDKVKLLRKLSFSLIVEGIGLVENCDGSSLVESTVIKM